ncbi:hypothetical protein [Coralloluteibacterium thermophilus]|uniref:DUF4124 domain-containing protein n=1 Tax=Coralloluteibacterium thermophilum TaxID=2707049 RepID=A0ABV9NGK4_9GAMM
MPPRTVLALLLLVAATAPAEEVRVYRCTAADGSLSVQNTPCPEGQREEVRAYARPQDPPLPPPAVLAEAPAPVAAATVPPAPAVPATTVAPTLFECVRHDGSTYLDETGAGERRWVPLWALGVSPRRPDVPARAGESPVVAGSEHAPGTWVEDVCRPLGTAESCARRREELEAVRGRVFRAQPSERARLQAREAEIVAAMQACPSR